MGFSTPSRLFFSRHAGEGPAGGWLSTRHLFSSVI
jgi:hypothetical protein